MERDGGDRRATPGSTGWTTADLFDEHGDRVEVCETTFLRFGSYEIHAAREDHDTLRKLVRFTLERYYPKYAGTQLDIPGFFAEVAFRTAWRT